MGLRWLQITAGDRKTLCLEDRQRSVKPVGNNFFV